MRGLEGKLPRETALGLDLSKQTAPYPASNSTIGTIKPYRVVGGCVVRLLVILIDRSYVADDLHTYEHVWGGGSQNHQCIGNKKFLSPGLRHIETVSIKETIANNKQIRVRKKVKKERERERTKKSRASEFRDRFRESSQEMRATSTYAITSPSCTALRLTSFVTSHERGCSAKGSECAGGKGGGPGLGDCGHARLQRGRKRKLILGFVVPIVEAQYGECLIMGEGVGNFHPGPPKSLVRHCGWLTNSAFSECTTSLGGSGHCRHLPYCALDVFTLNVTDYLPFFCRIDTFAVKRLRSNAPAYAGDKEGHNFEENTAVQLNGIL
ncbi:unnamed protein product [Timema podura]|uniref:Uncharacterized protein n=1 Tax=Timema podura TaxID=61482 RepID=A0ABN7NZU9_TIMPD|nr:unnamed protein product [Timema podura]